PFRRGDVGEHRVATGVEAGPTKAVQHLGDEYGRQVGHEDQEAAEAGNDAAGGEDAAGAPGVTKAADEGPEKERRGAKGGSNEADSGRGAAEVDDPEGDDRHDRRLARVRKKAAGTKLNELARPEPVVGLRLGGGGNCRLGGHS